MWSVGEIKIKMGTHPIETVGKKYSYETRSLLTLMLMLSVYTCLMYSDAQIPVFPDNPGT